MKGKIHTQMKENLMENLTKLSTFDKQLKHEENGGKGTMRYLGGIQKNGKAPDINLCLMHSTLSYGLQKSYLMTRIKFIIPHVTQEIDIFKKGWGKGLEWKQDMPNWFKVVKHRQLKLISYVYTNMYILMTLNDLCGDFVLVQASWNILA